MSERKLTRRVDAHCHLDLYGDRVDSVVDQIIDQGIETIAVTNAPSVFFFTSELAAKVPLMHPAVGLHPELVHSHAKELPALIRMIGETAYVGEVGLDYQTLDKALRREQQRVFGAVLKRCAEVGERIITVHSRRAAADVIAMVGRDYPCSVILHWFSGTKRDVSRATANGLFFSVNVAMTRSQAGLALIKEMPRERIITESDGPFVELNGKPATPSSVEEVLRVLAGFWNEPVEQAAETVLNNFHRIGESKSWQG